MYALKKTHIHMYMYIKQRYAAIYTYIHILCVIHKEAKIYERFVISVKK